MNQQLDKEPKLNKETPNKETTSTIKTSTRKVDDPQTIANPEFLSAASGGLKDKAMSGLQTARSTATNSLQFVADTATKLEWRNQVSRRPVAASLGALGVGLLIGYTVKGALTKRKTEIDDDYYVADFMMDETRSDDDDFTRGDDFTRKDFTEVDFDNASSLAATSDSANAASSYSRRGSNKRTAKRQDSCSKNSRGLLSKLTDTSMFGRLQSEVAKLSNQAIEQLSDLGNNVLVPAISSKIKTAVGNPNATADGATAATQSANDTAAPNAYRTAGI